jgi:hypothetical protein
VDDDVHVSVPSARTGGRTPGRLRIAYVYRNFNRVGSIESLYVRQAERLAADEDVTAFCSAGNRIATSAPISFVDVEPVVR